ncbi:CD99 molecule isoform X3 [Gadus morhua]|uniref:CD99 molecule isoform X3 n=1 Tax=Gadus morhua TaxID=8049 RepID=UPI0011B76D3B|nr:glycoprotein Xg isoform X3 [Gadus morhua]
MKLCLWIAALLLVVVGTNADGELDLMDAFGLDPEPETEKPKKPISGGGGEFDLMDAFGLDALDPDPTNPPKVPEKAKPKSNDGELDLMDAFGLDPEPETEKPKKPISGGGDSGFDLGDALGPDPEPEKPKKPTSGGGDPDPKPAVPPKTGGGGGGGFDDSDLWDDSKGELKPEGGAGGQDPNNDGGADQPQDPWVRALRVLEANMPEGVHIWLANIKHSLVPFLERALQLLGGLA